MRPTPLTRSTPVVDAGGLCVASEALVGGTAPAAVIVAQRARSWDVAALVAALTDDDDEAERFADALCAIAAETRDAPEGQESIG